MGVMPEGTVLGPIGDRVLFENDRIRVWTAAIEPGGRQPWHRHELPYLVVALGDGEVEILFDDGTVRHSSDTLGLIRWREPGEIHEFHNIGTKRFEFLLVEMKDRS